MGNHLIRCLIQGIPEHVIPANPENDRAKLMSPEGYNKAG
jgi:hypothetical protein